ncbi:hypothetical protein R1sor_014554 [Riccia sorocarpa]|uniref:Uncharacterized protein n=1 Tax=Riccia sorocarpa TaxID=122646 RepID=A0ABD3H9Q3_9MARC
MSRAKKRPPRSVKLFSVFPIKGVQSASRDTVLKSRPKHTYSLRPHDYLKRKSPATPPVNGPPPQPLQSADSRSRRDRGVKSYAALPALVFTQSQKVTPTPSTRRTCLGPPADPIQRHVYTIGLKIRGSPHARELRAKLSQLPTSTPSTAQSNLSMDGSVPADLEEDNTSPTSLEQQSIATQTPGCIAGCRLLKSNESTPPQPEDLHPKQLQQQNPQEEKSISPKHVKIPGKTESNPSTCPTHVQRKHKKRLGREVHAGHIHGRI